MLIGNLTRDPEMRYTPSGTAVCTFGLATNRTWVTDGGDKKEETEWHRIVAWNKLAELCSQLLFKGRRIYVEGRLQTRQWTGQDGAQRVATEIVIEDMIILDSRRQEEGAGTGVGTGAGYETAAPTEEELATQASEAAPTPVPAAVPAAAAQQKTPADDQPETKKGAKAEKTKKDEPKADDVAEDIPF